MPQTHEAPPDTWLKRQYYRARTWLRTVVGIDRAIAFTIFARSWASFAGLVTVTLIAHFLSPAEQGYYYTFGSLVALQMVFELGFSFVILQMASHERAHLTINGNDVLEGNPIAFARLASVLRKVVQWYSAAAGLLLVFLLFAGIHFFSAHPQNGVTVHWRIAWYVTALATAITFQIDPVLSFMEGCGFVPEVARVRFAQAITGSTLAWIALILHHGLFAPAAVISSNAIVAFIWLSRRRRFLLDLLRHDSAAHKISWTEEVWPFQWRIAISWFCGYFVSQLFNPVLFAYHGAVVAGQMGMSLSVANALQAVAYSWINTKAAPFGAMVARKEYSRMDNIFFRTLKQSVAVSLLGTLAIFLGILAINLRHLRFAERLLNPACVAALLAATTINIIIFAQALYLRAHKQEKFLMCSVLGATLVATSTYYLGKTYGATGVVIGNLVIAIFMILPCTYIFLKYRRIWHGE